MLLIGLDPRSINTDLWLKTDFLKCIAQLDVLGYIHCLPSNSPQWQVPCVAPYK